MVGAEFRKLRSMPTSFYVDDDVSSDVPDPHEWQLFETPTYNGLGPPRIRIQLHNHAQCGNGKFLVEDVDVDYDTDDDDVLDSSPVTAPVARIITRPPLQSLSSLTGNGRSSYIRKAKTNKRSVVDLMQEDVDGRKNKNNKNNKSGAGKKKTTTKQKGNQNIVTSLTPLSLPSKVTLTPSLTPLPNGVYQEWLKFVDNGGYKLTLEERCTVKQFVKNKQGNPVAIAEGMKFHRLIMSMRSDLPSSPRDAWDLVLPPKSYSNFEFCCLFLMIATPAVTDDSIIQVFGPLFRDNHVTPKWVIDEGESAIASRLRPLGRQSMSARYIVSAATNWKGMPRDYRVLSNFLGVGPKISLVCIAVCFGDHQGAPCDVHMVRIFKALGWMAVEVELDESLVKLETDKENKSKNDNEYEVARACIEGWFPKIAWGELNQTWAGLGQLLNKKEDRKKLLITLTPVLFLLLVIGGRLIGIR